jgi:hypothetical protein
VTSLYVEIVNILLFFQTIIYVGVFTGLILVPAIVIGYELQRKRRS